MSDSRGWRGVLLAAAVMCAVVLGIFGVWRQGLAGNVGDLERYYPLANGVTLTYRITHPDGAISYQSTNVERLPGADAIGLLDAASFGALMTILGQDVNNFDVDAANNALTQERFARVTDTEYRDSGAFTRTATLYLARPRVIGALRYENLSFDPPLPLLAEPLTLSQPQTVTGMINDVLPYTSALVVASRETIFSELGPFDDCLRVLSSIAIPDFEARSLSWFCAGMGLVRQENTDTATSGVKRFDIIGASTPAKAAHGPTSAPLAGLDARVRRVFPQATAGKLTMLWSYAEKRTNSGITTPILPAGDLLLYGTQTGGLVALQRSDRSIRWRFQTGSTVYGAPVVAGGFVYITSSDRRVYALDLSSGALRWVFATQDALTAGAAVSGDMVVVASEDRHIYALDARSGQERWRFNSGGAAAATPLIVGDVVYAGSDSGAFFALDLQTGEPRWALATGGAVTAAAAAADGLVYVASHDQALYALKAEGKGKDAAVVWSYQTREELTAEPVVSDGVVYLGLQKELHALDAKTGDVRWIQRSRKKMYGAPLVMGSLILVRLEHELLALDAASGREQSLAATSEAPAYAGLTSDGQNVLVGHFDGLLLVFEFARSSQ